MADVPPLQLPLHCTISPVVQTLPSLQDCPAVATQPPQDALLLQVSEQEAEVLDVAEQEFPEQAKCVPLPATLLQKAVGVPALLQTSAVQVLASLH